MSAAQPLEGVNDMAVCITLKGLRGGHSGLEINEGRGNANKLMARLVRQAIADDDARLASLVWRQHAQCHSERVPRGVILTIPRENLDDLQDLVAYCQDLFQNEYKVWSRVFL